MKKAVKWILIVVAIPITLFILAAVAIYIPPIQNRLVDKATVMASESTGYDITIDRVRLSFPLKLNVKEVLVEDRGDTIAYVDNIAVDVRLMPLFRGLVEVDELSLEQIQFDTSDIVDAARIDGSIGRLALESHSVDLGDGIICLNNAKLSDALLNVALNDSVPEDTTTSEPTDWKIKLEELKITNTAVNLSMNDDSMHVGTTIGKATIADGYFDLYSGLYTVSTVKAEDSSARFDYTYEPASTGLDYSHIAVNNWRFEIDSVAFRGSDLSLNVTQCAFDEKCGLGVESLTLALTMDSARLALPYVNLKTTSSTAAAAFDMDFSTFDEEPSGTMNAIVEAAVGKGDILYIAGDMLPETFATTWPNDTIYISGAVSGNMKRMDIAALLLDMPSACTIKAQGYAADITSPDGPNAEVGIEAEMRDLAFIAKMFEIEPATIPYGISIDGTVTVSGNTYKANLTAAEGGGNVDADVTFDATRMSYDAALTANGLQLDHFLPGYDLSPFSGSVTAEGCGVDFTSKATTMSARVALDSFKYGDYDLSGMALNAEMSNGALSARLDSDNDLLATSLNLNGTMSSKGIAADIDCDLNALNLQALSLTEGKLTVGGRATISVESDLNASHKVVGTISGLTLNDSTNTYTPGDIALDIFTNNDSTHAAISTGDLTLKLDAQGGYEGILACGDRIMAEIDRQINNRYIDQPKLRECLPTLSVDVIAGKDNVMTRMMNYYGCRFKAASLTLDTSPGTGVNGLLSIDSLYVADMQLDTIRFSLISDSINTFFDFHVRNAKDNPQYVFHAMLGGIFYEKGLYFGTRLYDADEQLGVAMGLNASMEENGIKLSIGGRDEPILGYKQFTVNEGNYLYLGDDRRVRADMHLFADDGMGFEIYTNNKNREALQDITVALAKFEISDVLSLVPYMPSVSGVLDGNVHAILTEDDLSLTSSLAVDSLVYEGCSMGDIGCDLAYTPNSDGSHHVDATLTNYDEQVAEMEGTYSSEGDGYIDIDLRMSRLPLALVNGFIPDQIVRLEGYGIGGLSVEGPLTQLDIDGTVTLDSAYLISDPYGVELRFAADPVTIENGRMQFVDFKMYAHNENALDISGYFDFSDFERMNMDMTMRAKDFLLIDAKENRKSEAFGKAYVNFFGMLTGTLDLMQLRGKLDVLGSTDMTYVLRDTPLTTDNQLEDIVTFVSFSDTTSNVITRPPLEGMDIDLTISIDESAHILCALNESQTNYVDLIGGGDLRMQYNSTEDLRLTGRYTLSNGEMKYSLPIIPLKTFTIQDGSYVEFFGEAMNPRLNITATEETKANVSTETGGERSVLFDCGVSITKTLSDMGLQFIIDAPEDLTIQSQLQTMSEERRGKIAVTMLTTGMYLDGESTGAFSMNSALSAYLNSQISNISGNALRTLDLSVGVDNTTLESGETQTDYSFKFAKRFWNNRLNISVGGKVTTGAETEDQNNSFFNNVTFEYRLSDTSNTYLKMFYERDSYDWLEGNIGEYGGGLLFKRKLQHFGDLFKWKKTKQTKPQAEPNDSIK